MLDKRLLWTSIAITGVVMVAVVIAALPQRPDLVQSQELVSDLERESSADELEEGYVLREHEGRIGVFSGTDQEPDMVLDVLVRHLPELDQIQLRQGVPAKDYAELVRLIEDYSS